MADLSEVLEKLSPEKRKLLELKLKQQGSQFNTFPVSFAQQRLWFLDQLEPNNFSYNIPLAFRVKGDLNYDLLKKAIQTITDRHEAVRTTFTSVNGKPMQVVRRELKVDAPVIDLTSLPSEQRDQEIKQIIDRETRFVFDLKKGPLFRIQILKAAEKEHVILLNMHHIISDGWSMGIIVQEISHLYSAYVKNVEPQLPPLKIQYADFAKWQRDFLTGERLRQELEFWKKQLGANPPLLELPTDKPRPAVKSYRGSRVSKKFSAEMMQKINNFSARNQVTNFMTLLAAFKVLLFRYTGQNEIYVGTPIANRNRPEIQNLIGFFVNTLVINSNVNGEQHFSRLIKQIKETAINAFAHEDIPFEMLVEELQPERSLSHTPLFQVMFVHQSRELDTFSMADLEVEPIKTENESAKFDLTLTVAELPDGLSASLEYDSDLFEPQTIDRMLEHYGILLQKLIDSPELPIGKIDYLTDGEHRLVLEEWISKDVYFKPEKCVHHLIEEQAKKRPKNIALRFNDSTMTYEELNARANRLAHYLIQLGAGPERLVAVYMERSDRLIVTLLAILKSGAAYLPVDPVYPTERVAFILKDAQPKLLVTENSLIDQLPQTQTDLVNLDRIGDRLAGQSAENPRITVDPEALIYAIYTSGSTGKPKGTLITHYNVVRLLQATDHWFHFNDRDVWTLFHSFAFDFSAWEIWGALSYGASLVVVPYLTARNPADFYQLLIREKVTILNQTPSAFQQLTRAEEELNPERDLLSLRCVIFGGEALELNSLRPWINRHGDQKPRLINMYGITETTVHVTYRPITLKDVEESKGSVIGCSIPDLQVYILDQNLLPAPVGVPGEIFVGGAGLARGYLNRPDLTAEKFIANPFSDNAQGDGFRDRLYRSGDLARWLPNGDMEYIGRIDFQVKIRGFRIELGEIETLLNRHPTIREAVVLVREDIPGDKRLVAYLLGKSDQKPDVAVLRDYLKERLPDYMIPAAFVIVDEFPLTPNGKIDRRALPAPDSQQMLRSVEYIPPSNPTEQLLADIFGELLNIPQVGAAENFFESGGHSLLATQLVSRIRDSFKVDLPLRVIFESPTVGELARLIEREKLKKEGIAEKEIKPVPRDRELPLSFAQQRLWFIDQLEPGDPSYNIPTAFKIKGDFDPGIFKECIQTLVRRHESLRTTFDARDGKPFQVIHDQTEIPLPVTDLSHLPANEQNQAIRQWVTDEARQSFDLSKGPLLRLRLLKLQSDQWLVVLTMHHIISDGWSIGIFIDELARLYRSYQHNEPNPLPPLRLQYADFAAWQREWLSGEILERQLNYWRRQLGKGSPPLQLPTDRPRPRVQTSNGQHLSFDIPLNLSRRLNNISRQHGATMFMTLLAAFKVLLFHYTQQKDISVGTPIANRNRSDIEKIIGFFVNTLVIRSDLSDDPSFNNYLKQIREITLDAYAHQDIPFEKLVDEIHPERDLSHHPLFQVMFLLQNIPAGTIDTGELKIESLEVENKLSLFDITLVLTEGPNGLKGGIEYNTDLFEEETVKRFCDHYVRILEQIADNPDIRLSEIELLSEEEYRRQVTEWNQTSKDLPRVGIHRLFEQQAAKTPEATALISGGQELTYRELNERANRLANYLQTNNIGSGSKVGLSLERSPALIVALIAVLKSGAAYVPLDPHYPQNRLQFMINDSKIDLLITQTDFEPIFKGLSVPLLFADSLDKELAGFSADNLSDPHFHPEQLAYVIYTSGSTGTPKGVLIPHRSVVNHNLSVQRIFGLTANDRVLQFATINFDASVEEIFPVLQTGGTLVLRGKDAVISADDLLALIKEHAITVLDLPTAYWQQWVAELLTSGQKAPESVRLVVLGGDRAAPETVQKWNRLATARTRLINSYGPTETTIVSTAYEATEQDRQSALPVDLPIGRPIDNTRVYVLNRNLRPVPIGIPGELVIGGAGLAHGYLNRPDLTAEAFVPDPFSGGKGERLYRTGDLVRYRKDGNLEFLGRIDHQVKIRGFRVEPGEVESALLQHPNIKEAVVAPRADQSGAKRLVAYCVPVVMPELAKDDRRSHIRIPFEGRAVIKNPEGRKIESDLKNISAGGMRIVYEQTQIKDQPIHILLYLDDDQNVLELKGRLAWQDGNHLGIRFVGLDESAENELNAAINRIIEERRVFVGELRGFLTAKLPDYMIPSHFVLLENLPKTPSGKIDRRALPDLEGDRPELKTEYVAPQSEKEKILTEIWQQVLGVEKIGIHDNFFELGGDSILSIQVISRARQKGLEITPIQIFRNQTVAELAQVVSKAPVIEAEQGLVSGEAPLTPIMHWFVEQKFKNPHHYNQALLFQVKENLNPELLKKTTDKILEHHDALRSRLVLKGKQWTQEILPEEEEKTFFYFDLKDLKPDEQKQSVEQICAETQASLNLQKGPVFKVAYFDCGAQPDRLLIAAHHIAIDGVSWRILLEDFQNAYQQLARAGEAVLPPKTTSFKTWAQKLAEFAESETIEREKSYWIEMAQKPYFTLPTDFPAVEPALSTAERVRAELDEDSTNALLKDAPPVYNTNINDLLLAALVSGFSRWTGKRSLRVHLEGHGRENLFRNVDVSRTVGWFTALYPVQLDLAQAVRPGEVIKTIKEQLHRIPSKGVGFGVLRYLYPDKAVRSSLAKMDRAEITFNYLGQFDQMLQEDSPFAPAAESKGADQSPENKMDALFNINGGIQGGKLRMTFEYSNQQFRKETVRFIADSFIDELKKLIRHCLSPEAGGVTASDFELANLSNKKLDSVLSQLKKKKKR